MAAVVAADDAPYRPTTSGPFVTFTAPITPKGRWLLQPIVAAGFAHGGGPRVASITLFTEFGIADDLAFGAQAQALLTEQAGVSSEGPADTLVFARRTILRERGWWPEATVLGQVKLPTDARGTGTPDLTIGLDATRGLRPVLVHVDLLFTHPIASAAGDQLAWAASIEWPFWPDRLGAMLELSGKHQVTAGAADEVVLGLGLEVLFSADLQILAGYQRTLFARNLPAFDTVIVTVVPTFL